MNGRTMKQYTTVNLSRAVIGGILARLGLAVLAAATAASAQTFTLLHTFTGSDGSYPVGSLIQSNATLYGMTQSGAYSR